MHRIDKTRPADTWTPTGSRELHNTAVRSAESPRAPLQAEAQATVLLVCICNWDMEALVSLAIIARLTWATALPALYLQQARLNWAHPNLPHRLPTRPRQHHPSLPRHRHPTLSPHR